MAASGASKAARSPWAAFKKLGHAGEKGITSETGLPLDSPLKQRPQEIIRNELLEIAKQRNIKLPPGLQPTDPEAAKTRLPRNVQALYYAPLRRAATHGIPVCNLQMRSYSVRNVEFMADFAMRAAYYLNLPASGPVPLPRITERWTVPRSNFVHKKTQENWERVTLRRLIQIQDGHPEVVQKWLAFVRKWQWHGVGLKADVFQNEELNVSERMDQSEEAVERGLEAVDWELFGRRRGLGGEEHVSELLAQRGWSGSENVESSVGQTSTAS